MEPELKTFCMSYDMDGSEWAFEIKAADFEDAHRRLQSIRDSGKVDGVFGGTIPFFPGAGLIVRLICWWKNRNHRIDIIGTEE